MRRSPGALKQAASQREPLQLRGLQVQVPGGVQIVDVTVQALHEPAALQGMTWSSSAMSRRLRRSPSAQGANRAGSSSRGWNCKDA